MDTTTARIVVLGGTSGIGLASARRLIADHQVTIAGRSPERLQAALATLGQHADGHVVDATDRSALEDFYHTVGHFDHLIVAVTGVLGGGLFRDLDLNDICDGLAAKTLPQLHALQAALSYLRPDGSATLITAVSALMANPATAGLAVINAGLEAAVRTLAVELAPLRINAISPGVINTPYWVSATQLDVDIFTAYAQRAPVGRVGTAEDVAHAVSFLIEATFITGVILPVDGGFHLHP